MATGDSNPVFQLTEKDNLLLALLQANARESTALLARKLGVSRSTLQERITRLEKAGVISGYSVRINQGRLAAVIKCFCFVACDNKNYASVVRQLHAMDSVKAVHSISGEWDLIIQMNTRSLETLNEDINAINGIPGVARTASNIVMETKFDRLTLSPVDVVGKP